MFYPPYLKLHEGMVIGSWNKGDIPNVPMTNVMVSVHDNDLVFTDERGFRLFFSLDGMSDLLPHLVRGVLTTPVWYLTNTTTGRIADFSLTEKKVDPRLKLLSDVEPGHRVEFEHQTYAYLGYGFFSAVLWPDFHYTKSREGHVLYANNGQVKTITDGVVKVKKKINCNNVMAVSRPSTTFSSHPYNGQELIGECRYMKARVSVSGDYFKLSTDAGTRYYKVVNNTLMLCEPVKKSKWTEGKIVSILNDGNTTNFVWG